MAGDHDEAAIELRVEPGTDRFDPDDDRWRSQAAEFSVGLGHEVGGMHKEYSQVAGTRGAVESVILALGSAGVFAAAVDYFRAWLARDRTRSLHFSHTVDGREETFTIHGEAIDLSVLETTLRTWAAASGRAVSPDG